MANDKANGKLKYIAIYIANYKANGLVKAKVSRKTISHLIAVTQYNNQFVFISLIVFNVQSSLLA